MPAAVAGFDGDQRRGTGRARNVTRPQFGAKPEAQATVAKPQSIDLSKTGNVGAWSSF